MKLTESTLRSIIRQELSKIVKENTNLGYFNPGGIDVPGRYGKEVQKYMGSGRAKREPQLKAQLADLYQKVQDDVQKIKTLDPDSDEWATMRDQIIKDLERVELISNPDKFGL